MALRQPVPVEQADAVGAVHFIAAGGAGMSGIAAAYAALGVPTSGSDMADSDTLRKLAREGVTTYVGHDPAQLGDAATVVVSSAIRESNVELAEARRRGLRVWHRSAALAGLMVGRRGVAITGTHGKTTTTGMTATMLVAVGADPSYVIGSPLTATGESSHLGVGDAFVIEADESDGSFLQYPAEIVVVTNVEADHLDHYSGIEEIEATFAKFMSLVGEDGTVIVCGEDPHLVELAKSTGRHVLSYGFAESNDIVCMHPDVKGIQSDFIVRFEDGTEHAVEIKSNPGRHNMLNATAVLTVAHVLGLDIDAAAKALSSFEGVRRRFTHVGDIDGITVVDDYGHHPTEIKATLAAASSLGYKHVDVVFQPHRYSRLQALCDDFADAFANADKLLLIDVFSAGEMPIPGVTSKMLADTVRAKHPGKEVVYCSSRLELNQELEQMVGEGDLLLTMGAGDVTTVGPEFLEYLTAKKDA